MLKTKTFTSTLLILSVVVLSGCSGIRAIFLNYPDENDAKRFPKRYIHNSNEIYHFADKKTTVDLGESLKLDDWTYNGVDFRSLRTILQEQNTTAFLIIKNDTLLYEDYFLNASKDTKLTSFSVAKSFTSALIGIAIKEGKITSLESKVIDYIPELRENKGFEKIQIKHLLNHTSGIKCNLLLDGKFYYASKVLNELKHLKLAYPPGTKQQYLNLNTQLLGIVLSRATGVSCSEYLQNKIWSKIGMESDAFWSLDRKNGTEKSFCCINATAHDFAKLGILYLNNGVYNGEQIIDSNWVQQTISRDTSEGSSFGYNYSWYIGLKNYNDFMAIGLYKQFIYVNKEKKIVIVRLGNRANSLYMERIQWTNIFRQIADQL